MNFNPILFLGFFLLTKTFCWAEDSTPALDVEQLKSIAALNAVKNGNIELLEELTKTGWDPAKLFASIPGAYADNINPATYAVMMGSDKVLLWLKKKSPRIFDVRNGYLQRPIDSIIEQKQRKDIKEDVFKKCMDILSKDREKIITDPREELFVSMTNKGGKTKHEIISVNGNPPDKSWEDVYSSFYNDSVKPILDKNSKLSFVAISWEKKNDLEYKFSLSFFSDQLDEFPGGSVNGTVVYKYGYWVSEQVEFMDH